MSYRNSEGYYDPTAGEAISQYVKGRKKRRPYRPLVYLCSPFAGDTVRNIQKAQEYCRFAVSQGCIPVAAHLLFPQFLDDDDPKERKLGLFFGKILMDRCDEVWMFGETFSSGMQAEHDRALRKGYRVRYFTSSCRMLSDGGDGDGCI